MEKKTIRSGFIGSGFAASFQYEAVQKVFGVNIEVVGAHSLDGPGLDAWCSERGVQAFHELEPLLEQVDLIHVCTIASTHEEITVKALLAGKDVIVEKPLTGYFGDGSEEFNGDTCSRELALREGMASVRRMIDAERKGGGRILYAENWIYAPAVQKEREIIEKTGAQILWIQGEQAHSGSHAATYGYWKFSGGGVMISKGCHPLSVALYFKRKEGLARNGKPIRPVSVTSRVHALTRMPEFRDEGHIRNNYHDIDDFSMMHVVFEDGTVADIVASDIVLGGVKNKVEVCANNHRTICNMNPSNSVESYNPVDANYEDIYVAEKIETKQGWNCPQPDENWAHGYAQEIDAFYRCAAYGEPLESDSGLAADCIATIYSAYLSDEHKGAEVAIEQIPE